MKVNYVLVVLLLSGPAHAQYKCLARDGVTEYRSTPCAPNAKPLNSVRVVPGPSSEQPSGPNYWQREAARLERKEAQEQAEATNAQRAVDAAHQAEFDRKQAIAAQKAQEARESEQTDKVVKAMTENTQAIDRARAAAAAAAEAARPKVCTGFGTHMVCN